LDHLLPEEREHIEPVLMKYAHIFRDEKSNDFKGKTFIEHPITVGDAQSMRRTQYRTPYALRAEMEQQVQKMLQKGVIRPSTSPSWSRYFISQKIRGRKSKIRFCVDFLSLNAVINSTLNTCRDLMRLHPTFFVLNILQY